MESKITTVAKKELSTYFSSPVAFIFLGTFLVVSMFVFFWVDTFFARNIADVRPLFNWMPVLLIFLVSALTMRMWSEERRMGTIEFLLTVPVKTQHLVFGKFLACMGLVTIALALTLFIPITVSIIGDLDWGPVIGGYVAALLLAGAYTAIGLYVSSKNDNQIVSLILTLVVCSVFFLIGSQALGGLVGNRWAEVFSLIGTGSRFDAVTRGMIDIRDLYYYLSLIGVFLTLNIYALETLRWSDENHKPAHKRLTLATGLLIVNLAAANLWLYKTYAVRVDLTEGQSYTISDATKKMLEQLQEPLLIRGYFSAKTHPLLAPLVPRLRDLIREYAVASHGRVRAEFVDPRENPELEEEAARKYNIKPIPFQVADKYQAALVNSYFDILVEYGDKYETLAFRELIDVKPVREGEIDVELRNPEYDITRAIKKVLYGFQSTDSLFASLNKPVEFVGYISDKAKLPEKLVAFSADLDGVLSELKKSAQGKFDFAIQDPIAEGGKTAKEISEKFGFRPMVLNLFDTDQFYFYMLLQSGDKLVQVPLPENLSKEGAQKAIEGALKRFSPGFLKTIGFSSPPPPQQNPMMPQYDTGKQFRVLQEKLSETHAIKNVDLQNGLVPDDVDLLFVVSPENFTPKQLFAVDQFLMKGGTVLLSTAPYKITRSMTANVSADKNNSGLSDWLKSYGIVLEDKLVMDPENEPYPIQKNRKAGMFTVQEVQLVPYPLFVDVRGSGLNKESLITARIPEVTLNWASPVVIDAEKNKTRKVTTLLKSSKKSWATAANNVQPDFEAYDRLGFPVDGPQKPYVLAAEVKGAFESFFKGKDSPLVEAKQAEKEGADDKQDDKAEPDKKDAKKEALISGVIEKSSEAARILVFASNEFLTDQVLQISALGGTSRYVNSLQLMENAVDASLEDPTLLAIRSRGHYARTLQPMTDSVKAAWEYSNYGVAILGLLLVYLLHVWRRTRRTEHYKNLLSA